MESDCIFCKIVKGEIPTKFEHEDDLAVAFSDINPQTPIHLLVIPREHIASVNDLPDGPESDRLIGHLINVAKRLAEKKGIKEDGYKLLLRTGKNGGQEVPHIHLHLFGGGKMSEGIGLINDKV